MKKINLSNFVFGLFALTASQCLMASEYWLHGNIGSVQTPSQLQLVKAGAGAIATIPAATSGTGGWLQFPLPLQTNLYLPNSTVTKILLQYTGNAKIDQVDVWHGSTKVGGASVNWTGSNSRAILALPTPVTTIRGLNISVHVKNNCAAGSLCPKQTMKIISVGSVLTP
ncbi:MAG: hypothetical protein ABL933_12935 [Methyloglobulus sp.]|nr:hypothetical protein [Methyloglobulus sp.]